MTISEFMDEMETIQEALDVYTDMYEDDIPDKFTEKLKNIIYAMKINLDEMTKSFRTNPNDLAPESGSLGKADTKKSEPTAETLKAMMEKLKNDMVGTPIELQEQTEAVLFGYSDAEIFKAYSRGMRDAADAAYYFSDELVEEQNCES